MGGSLSYNPLKYDGKNPLIGTRNIVGVLRANNSFGGGVETIDNTAESGYRMSKSRSESKLLTIDSSIL